MKQIESNERMSKELESQKQEIQKRQNVWISRGIIANPKRDVMNPETGGKALFSRRDTIYDAKEIEKDLEKV